MMDFQCIRRPAPNGKDVSAIYHQGNLWMSQDSLGVLLSTTTQAVNQHVAEIRKQIPDAHERKFCIMKDEGMRRMQRKIVHLPIEVSHAVALRARSWDELNWIVELAKSAGLNRDFYKVIPVKERDFSELLTGILNGVTPVERQYSVGKYRIDFYLPEHNIAVEYDEKEHLKTADEDRRREDAILQMIQGVKFIRVAEGMEIDGLNRVVKALHVGF